MKEMTPCQTTKQGDVQSQGTRSKVPIERDLEGHICPNCGSRRYCLVIRVVGGRYSGLLAARCSRCREPTMLMPNVLRPHEIEQEINSERQHMNHETID
jgi:hypothetical protein